jgi:hypothetical protein
MGQQEMSTDRSLRFISCSSVSEGFFAEADAYLLLL